MITYQNSNIHFAKNTVFFLERSSRRSPLHWHDAIEFVYILDGEMEFGLNGERFTASAGELIAVDSAIVHSFRPISESVDYYFLVADDKFFKANGLYTDTTLFERRIKTDEARRDEYSNISTLSVLMSLFIYMNRHHSRIGKEAHPTEEKKIIMVRSALLYIQEHYKEKLTVEGIAEALHFSKSYLSHSFKEITHTSLISYINLLRCQNARTLMLDGSGVAEAAADCGFSEISYFTRVFKKTLGILPSEVRAETFTLNNKKG